MITNTYTYDHGTSTLTLTRPENTIYQRDRNILKFEIDSVDRFDYIEIEIVYNGATIETLRYEGMTENWFIIDLTDRLRDITPVANATGYLNFDAFILDNGGGGTWYQVTQSNTNDVKYSLTAGRTLTDRKHVCERVIRYYSDMSNVSMIYNDYANGFNYVFDDALSNYTPDANGTIYISEAGGGGTVDMFVRDGATTFKRKLKLMCTPKNAVWIRYTNTDGCKRYVACKPLSADDDTDGLQYSVEGCERHKGAQYVTKLERALSLGVEEVEYAEFMTDIRYADDVEFAYSYSTGWKPCILKNMKFTEDGAQHNATINVIVNI